MKKNKWKKKKIRKFFKNPVVVAITTELAVLAIIAVVKLWFPEKPPKSPLG